MWHRCGLNTNSSARVLSLRSVLLDYEEAHFVDRNIASYVS